MKKTMPRKKENFGKHFIEHACKQIKDIGKAKELYRKVYGVEGTENEVQTFINRLNANRANPGLDFIGWLVERLPELQEMTLGEFFGISKDR
ncbi:hypothetical protein [Pseudoalteromonas sp. Of7M-16]|uniref:hypothetical protein n=1 Tax=Pseudoalteromonas sp. Of7M-16 TaxID=2917756 RepID=UPI001EF4F894|nr:hypothetical protein [Pseudoalteromonas sp. Of7M-16]MCG7551587.1 hypothetical protein [Pseudoalteromonas sp. Of7M-16]